MHLRTPQTVHPDLPARLAWACPSPGGFICSGMSLSPNAKDLPQILGQEECISPPKKNSPAPH